MGSPARTSSLYTPIPGISTNASANLDDSAIPPSNVDRAARAAWDAHRKHDKLLSLKEIRDTVARVIPGRTGSQAPVVALLGRVAQTVDWEYDDSEGIHTDFWLPDERARLAPHGRGAGA